MGAPGRCAPEPASALDRGDVAVGEPFTLTGRTGRPVHGTLFRPTLRGTRRPGRRPHRRW